VYVAMAVLMVAACGPDEHYDLPSDVVWTSPHFSLYARAQDENVCADALGILEQHFTFLQSMFGFDWPDGRAIHYYKFIDRADFVANAPCPEGSGACADQGDVYSAEVFEQHELVHSYLGSFGSPPALVTEGTAVALACNRAISDAPSLSLAEALLIQEPLRDTRIYDTGGRLVRFLLDQYGPGPFLRFYASLGKHAGLDELDRALLDVFGAGVDDIWAAALATPASCPSPFACSRQPLVLDGATSRLSPICGVPALDRTFTLLSDGELALWAPPSSSVGSCDAIRFSAIKATGARHGDSQVGLLALPAGRYYVEAPADTTTRLALLAAPPHPWAGFDCSALQPFVVTTGQYPDIGITIPAGVSEWIVRLSFVEPHLLRLLSADSPRRKNTVTVCRDCDFSSSSCQSFDMSSGTRDFLWQGDYVLRAQTSDSMAPTRLDIVQR
jgi:hypothetical protein